MLMGPVEGAATSAKQVAQPQTSSPPSPRPWPGAQGADHTFFPVWQPMRSLASLDLYLWLPRRQLVENLRGDRIGAREGKPVQWFLDGTNTVCARLSDPSPTSRSGALA